MTDNPNDMASVIAKIEKLLALGQNNDNEHQAAAAMAKVQAMLEAYNLDMSVIGKSGKEHQGAQRKDQTGKGGLYGWQRKLWRGVAELNFCHYMSIKGLAKGSVYEHRMIGSHANVVSTEIMAKYLQQTIERLAQAWAKERGYHSVFVRDAIAYRDGMADRIVDKLSDRRRQVLAEERIKTEERKKREAAEGIVTGNAMTLVEIISTEADFNNDYLNGWELGTTAQNRHDNDVWYKKYQAEQQAEKARKMAEWEAFQRAYPERAAKMVADELAKQRKEQERWHKANRKVYKERYRKPTSEESRRMLPAFQDGYRDGAQVGIDTQVDATEHRRIG